MQRYDMYVAYYSPDVPYVESEPINDGSWVRADDVDRLEQIERAAKAYLDAHDSPFGGRALQSYDEWLIRCSDARAALRKALEAI